MTVSSETSDRPRVLAVVVARKGDDIGAVLESIDRQVYGIEDVVVMAERPTAISLDAALRPKQVRSMSEVVALAGDRVEYLWLLDSRTTARRDALAALVSTAVRVDASVVGSKVLDAANPQQLLSVGGATDVFGFPFTGLERGELDQEQFDVIRDVALLEPASMLVRRDLAGGLGGLDRKLPYIATGLDLCQRARVVGGRVVVGPTSEVFTRASGEDRVNTWREQAGRIRVMIKTYSPVTLLWSLPGLLMVSLLNALYHTARGSWQALPDWIGAWLWNVRHLGSTLEVRRRAPGVSMDSDAELFRFQVRGSVQLRAIVSDVGAMLGAGSEFDEEGSRLDESQALWQRPTVLAIGAGIAFLIVLTRSILMDGLPVTGFVLPLPESAWSSLRSYAGGWHLAGLGSPEPMHPSVGATAAVQLLLGNRAASAATILTVGSAASAAVGTFVLVRRAGLGLIAAMLAGGVIVAGFPTLVLAGEGYWPGLVALGGIPWACAGIVAPAPAGLAGWVGRLARAGLATAWSAAFVPPAVVVPLLFGAVWAVASRRGRSLAVAFGACVPALPVLLPWLPARELSSILSGGVPFHPDPDWWVAYPILVAGLAAGISGRGRPMSVAMTGAVIGSGGFLAARAASLGAGLEVTAAGLLAASLGLALTVAGAVEGPSTLGSAKFVRRTVAYVGVGAAALIGLATVVVLPSGRMGLPEDRFGPLAFAESRAGQHGADRILLAGPGDSLPGEYRRLPDGTAYRVVSGSLDYSQAWLPQPLEGDLALERTLMDMLAEEEFRPGRALAGYGIGWVVAMGPTPLAGVMSAQLDLRPLNGLFIAESGGVWENTADAYRAVTDTGVPWSWRPPGYEGRSLGSSVRISENADPGWSPSPWEPDGWANRVPAGSGVAFFEGVPDYRLMAQAAGAWVLVLVLLAFGLPLLRRRQSTA